MSKKLQYLNNKGLMSLCEKGETSEINDYIALYSDKIAETSEDLVAVEKVIEILDIEKSIDEIKGFLGNKHILPKTLIELCHKLNIQNDHRLQYEELLKLQNEINWYEYIVEELQKSLGE